MSEGYKGIDYGMGLANVDTSTGIRYGILPVGELAHWAWDEFESVYPDPACPNCGGELTEYDPESQPGFIPQSVYCESACVSCEKAYSQEDTIADEPIGHVHDREGLQSHIDDSNDAWITLSPYFTRAQFCSPCAPGACHLSSPIDNGERAYCFGHDWFENGKAPYPVYSVATGELIPPPSDV